MEIWVDPVTNQIKAVYFDRYTGVRWGDAGYIAVQTSDKRVLPGFEIGAIVDISGPVPIVTLPPPTPVVVPNPGTVRLGELSSILKMRDLSIPELSEYLRLGGF